jgi:hypothetical protein
VAGSYDGAHCRSVCRRLAGGYRPSARTRSAKVTAGSLRGSGNLTADLMRLTGTPRRCSRPRLRADHARRPPSERTSRGFSTVAATDRRIFCWPAIDPRLQTSSTDRPILFARVGLTSRRWQDACGADAPAGRPGQVTMFSLMMGARSRARCGRAGRKWASCAGPPTPPSGPRHRRSRRRPRARL